MTRPVLHATARDGWLNDPLGLTWHDGLHHLFAQHVPGVTSWRLDCHWAHFTSADLLHWDEQPVALAPGDGDDGVWSGSLVASTIFYTSVSAASPDLGRVRTARPVDSSWVSWAKGPVVVEPPADLDLVVFRDPFVRRSGPGWQMLVGAGLADGSPCVVGFSSPDLVSWTCDGLVARGVPGDPETGAAWECPQVVTVGGRGGRDVLVVSVWSADALSHVAASVLTATGPGPWTRLTDGTPYAGSVFHDPDGRPGLVCWLRDVAGDGWAGAISAPSLLGLDGDRVVVTPHPAVDPHLTGGVLVDGPVREEWRDGVLRASAHASPGSG